MRPKLIGEGNFGRVFVVTGKDANGVERPVAQKRLVVINQSSFCSGLSEIYIASQLNHPNIVTLYNVTKLANSTKTGEGRYDDYALDFEYVPQGDIYNAITTQLEAGTYWNLREVKSIFTQCLLGVWYMHRNGYIHRDIKPTNVLIAEGNVAKICDFGYAKKYLTHDSATREVGSQYFRAPEVLLEQSYDYKSDIWSLGCILHYLMTGGAYFVEAVDLNDPCIDGPHVSPDDIVTELRYIMAAMPYPITIDMFRGDTGPLVTEVLRSTSPLTEIDFFEKHRFAMDQDNVLYYQVFLFKGMLVVDPRLRKSASELLSAKFLDSDSACKRLIENERVLLAKRAHELNEDRISSSLSTCSYKHMAAYARKVFVEYRNELWYTDKILFSAIDIFSRTTTANRVLLEPTAAESKVIGFFQSCLYLAIKYGSHTCASDYRAPAYNKLPFVNPKITLSDLSRAKAAEDSILNVLHFQTFNLTVLDILLENEVPNLIDVVSLFLYVTSSLNVDDKGNTLTPQASYRKWIDNQRYREQTEGHKLWQSVQSAQ
jgi:serine/threonine protein kinase